MRIESNKAQAVKRRRTSQGSAAQPKPSPTTASSDPHTPSGSQPHPPTAADDTPISIPIATASQVYIPIAHEARDPDPRNVIRGMFTTLKRPVSPAINHEILTLTLHQQANRPRTRIRPQPEEKTEAPHPPHPIRRVTTHSPDAHPTRQTHPTQEEDHKMVQPHPQPL